MFKKLVVFSCLLSSGLVLAGDNPRVDLSPGTSILLEANEPTEVSCGRTIRKLACSSRQTKSDTIRDNFCMEVFVGNTSYGEYCASLVSTATQYAKERIEELQEKKICN
jgi:hypothetical protein